MNGDSVTIHRSSDAGSTFSPKIASVVGIEPAEVQKDMQENTEYGNTEDPGWKTYSPGLKDGGEMTLTTRYKEGQNDIEALEDSFENDTLEYIQFQYPAPISKKITYKVYVSKVGKPIPLGQEVQRVFGMKITGKPVEEALS